MPPERRALERAPAGTGVRARRVRVALGGDCGPLVRERRTLLREPLQLRLEAGALGDQGVPRGGQRVAPGRVVLELERAGDRGLVEPELDELRGPALDLLVQRLASGGECRLGGG